MMFVRLRVRIVSISFKGRARAPTRTAPRSRSPPRVSRLYKNAQPRAKTTPARGSYVGRKQKGAPPKRGPSGWPADLGRQFLLEPEPDDGDGDVLWFALGWLAVDELPLCEGD
jgi:hypothetical protein